MSEDLSKVQAVTGCEFSDRALLRESFTHRSYSVENKLKYDNQRLEFLGDAILELILSEHLFRFYPDAHEGELTKLRAALVQEQSLARLARDLELGRFILIGRGEEESGGRERTSTLADLFESFLGAYYLDRGFEPAKAFLIGAITRTFGDLRGVLADANPKGLLQEYTQRRWSAMPDYQVLGVTGPEHQPCYNVEAKVRDYSATGQAPSRKHAEMNAARSLLRQLQNESEIVLEETR